MDTVALVAKILTILTVCTDVLIVAYLAVSIGGIFLSPLAKFKAMIISLVRPYARLLAFVTAIVAMSGSLFYSEVAGYTPCLLCWYQRIAMYPLVFLLGMAIVKNDKKIADYILMLSGIGAIISTYHYYIQRGGTTFIPCSDIGYSVSCSQRFTMEFGYVTIPVMALSAFVAISILMSILKK